MVNFVLLKNFVFIVGSCHVLCQFFGKGHYLGSQFFIKSCDNVKLLQDLIKNWGPMPSRNACSC